MVTKLHLYLKLISMFGMLELTGTDTRGGDPHACFGTTNLHQIVSSGELCHLLRDGCKILMGRSQSVYRQSFVWSCGYNFWEADGSQTCIGGTCRTSNRPVEKVPGNLDAKGARYFFELTLAQTKQVEVGLIWPG